MLFILSDNAKVSVFLSQHAPRSTCLGDVHFSTPVLSRSAESGKLLFIISGLTSEDKTRDFSHSPGLTTSTWSGGDGKLKFSYGYHIQATISLAQEAADR
ncbi:hypothetical protein RRG08_010638 [Elysia crispata]|uniref:Uncharacterized protein n=1 Tax=Elysia crispata TaxID=231223 RepID=A0AAE0XQY1_9GAST|nr:hypothetical protein RRG08_010638 [Elysia crispata]